MSACADYTVFGVYGHGHSIGDVVGDKLRNAYAKVYDVAVVEHHCYALCDEILVIHYFSSFGAGTIASIYIPETVTSSGSIEPVGTSSSASTIT